MDVHSRNPAERVHDPRSAEHRQRHAEHHEQTRPLRPGKDRQQCESNLQQGAQRTGHDHGQCCADDPQRTFVIVRAHHPDQHGEGQQYQCQHEQYAGNRHVERSACMPVHHVVVDGEHHPAYGQRPAEEIRLLELVFPCAVEDAPYFLGTHRPILSTQPRAERGLRGGAGWEESQHHGTQQCVHEHGDVHHEDREQQTAEPFIGHGKTSEHGESLSISP